MKAKEIIEVPNLRGFDEYRRLKEGNSSSFRVYPGEEVEDAMQKHGLTSVEIGEFRVRILRGNPHWVSVEKEEEKKEAKVVADDKEKEQKRKAELYSLNKKQQEEILKKLNVTKVPTIEKERVDLIYSLENRKR